MSQELALSHYTRQWLGQVAANAKIPPTRSSQRWLLHLTPDSLRIPAKLNSHSGQREHPDP